MNEIINNVDTASLATGTGFAYLLGAIAKKIESFPNKHIPILTCIVGALVVGAQEGFDLKNLLAGALTGWGATGAHQAMQQWFNDNNENKTP